MTLLEPGVFWSDIALGLLVLALGVVLLRRECRWWRPFLPLALATWTGAFYHGLVNTTDRLSGALLWTATLLLLALVAALLGDEILARRRSARVVLGALWAVYAVVAIGVSEDFLWALVLQGMAVAGLGVWFVVARRHWWSRRTFRRTGSIYLGFLGIFATAVWQQQAAVTFGLPMSHNTLFHFIQMPAVLLLAVFLDRVDDAPD